MLLNSFFDEKKATQNGAIIRLLLFMHNLSFGWTFLKLVHSHELFKVDLTIPLSSHIDQAKCFHNHVLMKCDYSYLLCWQNDNHNLGIGMVFSSWTVLIWLFELCFFTKLDLLSKHYCFQVFSHDAFFSYAYANGFLLRNF